MDRVRAKVLVMGPKRCGKTRIANFLAQQDAQPNFQNYNATKGARILELEEVVQAGKRSATCAVELWDCSGDEKYESCYPAMTQDASAAILVFDPDDRGQSEVMHKWYEWFVDGPGLRADNCLLIAMRQSKSLMTKPAAPRQIPDRVRMVSASFESGDVLKREFDRFVKDVESARR